MELEFFFLFFKTQQVVDKKTEMLSKREDRLENNYHG